MWYGKNTEELMKLKVQYEDLFGYNPDGEMDLEYDENSYNEYVHDLKEAIREKKNLRILLSRYHPFFGVSGIFVPILDVIQLSRSCP